MKHLLLALVASPLLFLGDTLPPTTLMRLSVVTLLHVSDSLCSAAAICRVEPCLQLGTAMQFTMTGAVIARQDAALWMAALKLPTSSHVIPLGDLGARWGAGLRVPKLAENCFQYQASGKHGNPPSRPRHLIAAAARSELTSFDAIGEFGPTFLLAAHIGL